MDAEAAAALGDVDDAGDELGHLLHQRGELVDDDHQRGRRLLGGDLEHLGEVLGPALHHPHPPVELGAQRCQGAQRQFGVEVGDVTHGVRQSGEHRRRGAALVVDEQEVEARRRVMHGERADDRLQQLALAGARCTTDQGVRSVLHEVEPQLAVDTHPDRERQPVGTFRQPVLGDPFGARHADAEHIEQRGDARDRRRQRRRRGVADRRQGTGDPVGDVGPQLLHVDLAIGDLRIGRPQRAHQRGAGRLPGDEDLLRLAGHLGGGVGEPDHRDADARALVEQTGDARRVGRQPAVEDRHDPRPATAGHLPFGAAAAEVDDLEQAAEDGVGLRRCGGDVRAGQRRDDRPGVRQPLHPRGQRAVADGSDDRQVLGAVQAGGLDDHRRGDAVDRGLGTVDTDDAVFGEVDGDRHTVDLVEAGEGGPCLCPQVLVTTAWDVGREHRRRGAEPGAEAQEVGALAAARPQIDGAQLGTAGQLGEVGRRAHPLDALRFHQRVELVAPRRDPLAIGRQLVSEAFASRATVVDRVGDHHQRRHQGQGEELHLAGEGEQRQPGGERCQHGEDLEPPLVATLGDRAELRRFDLRQHRWPVRRPLELDLAELVDALALGAHERPERDTSAAECDDVGVADGGPFVDLAVVDRHPVLGTGERGDRHRPRGVDGDRGVPAGHGRVAEPDVGVVVAADAVRAREQDVAGTGVGAGEHVDGDGLTRDRPHGADGARRTDDELVARHDADVADGRRRLEDRAGALQRDRRHRLGEPELACQGPGEIVDRVRRLDVDDEVGRVTAERHGAQDQFHRRPAVSQKIGRTRRPATGATGTATGAVGTLR